MAWVGLAAVAAGRHDGLLDGVLRWLRARREDWHGLYRGGADVRWASAEHNLEVRALLAALGEPVAALDAAIDRHLLVRDGPAALRQGFEDDVRPSDAQALGILWLCALGRDADARAVAATAEATLRVRDRRVDWPGAESRAFTGYRPYAGGWAPGRPVDGGHAAAAARARAARATPTPELDAAIDALGGADRAGDAAAGRPRGRRPPRLARRRARRVAAPRARAGSPCSSRARAARARRAWRRPPARPGWGASPSS